MKTNSSGFTALKSALANRDFRHYTSGNTFSYLAYWIQRITVGWLTWKLTGSPFWLGLMSFSDLAPSVALAPLAGAIADRVDRLRAIRITQTLASIQVATLAALTWTGVINVGLLLALTFALGIVMAFNQPLRLAAFPSLVERKDLPAAISINSLIFNIARIIGPATAGVIIERIDIAPCFALCSVFYFIFVITLLFVDTTITKPKGPPKPLGNIPLEIMEGVRYSVRHPGVGPVMIVMTVSAVFGRAFIELLPGFAGAVFGRGADGLAMLTSSMGAGAIVGGLVLATRVSVVGLTAIMTRGLLVFSAAVLAFALAPNIWVGMALSAISGYASVTLGISNQTLVQNSIEPTVRGRVMSLYGMIARAGPAIGALTMGAASELLGLRWPVVGGAVLVLLVWIWLRPRRARLAAVLEGEPLVDPAEHRPARAAQR
jgi:MFS family permease